MAPRRAEAASCVPRLVAGRRGRLAWSRTLFLLPGDPRSFRMSLRSLLCDVRACTVCEAALPLGARPILQAARSARLLASRENAWADGALG